MLALGWAIAAVAYAVAPFTVYLPRFWPLLATATAVTLAMFAARPHCWAWWCLSGLGLMLGIAGRIGQIVVGMAEDESGHAWHEGHDWFALAIFLMLGVLAHVAWFSTFHDLYLHASARQVR